MNGTAVKRTGGKKRWILLAALAVVFLLLILALDSRLTVRTYTLETDKVTAPVRLAVVTDLHSCAYGENQEELASAVLNLDPQPDGVLLVGDIVDDQLPEENAWTAVSRLAEFYCCFYVTGNHEWWSGEAERICREMERSGGGGAAGPECVPEHIPGPDSESVRHRRPGFRERRASWNRWATV